MKKATISQLEALDYMGQESLNTLCSNLSFAGKDLRKVVLTSVSASEGKSHVAMRIMETMARLGRRVVLVDGDLRHSALLDHYGIRLDGAGVGLAHYLSGSNTLDDVLYETSVPNAYLVPQGNEVVNPLALLHSENFGKLLTQLAERFDLVLVDTPPIGLVVDAAEIASCCDGAILVCEYAHTRRRDLALAKRQIEATNCPIVGCVINKVTFDSLSSQKHYNRAHYDRFSSYLHKNK